MTHYEVLGVRPDATEQEIRRAYRRLALLHHPDKQAAAGAAEAEQARLRMQSVNAAWAVLRDPARRRAYDAGLRAETGPAPPPRAPRPPDEADDVHPWWLEDEEPSSARPRAADLAVFAPVAAVVAAALAFVFGVLTESTGLMGVAFVLVPVAGFGFVAAPLLVMRSRARSRG